MNYVYIRSEPDLFTVGHYDPSGRWNPDSDYESRDDAAARVRYLNGGAISNNNHPELPDWLTSLAGDLTGQLTPPTPDYLSMAINAFEEMPLDSEIAPMVYALLAVGQRAQQITLLLERIALHSQSVVGR